LKELIFPVNEEDIKDLKVGEMVLISGRIFCGRDAVLPQVIQAINDGTLEEKGIELQGSLIFHTAVSVAGVGPTSSNKAEIEASIKPLSEAGVKMHLGKGQLKPETIKALDENNSVYAVIPPVTALLGNRTLSSRVVAFENEGMEALHELTVDKYPAVIAAAHGKSIYDKEV
jgi:fumarate hydratase subunit beta